MNSSAKPENASESAVNRNATETMAATAGSSQDVSALVKRFMAFTRTTVFPTQTHLQIESVLQQTQERFQTMSDHIIRRIDEMSKRVEELEKSITDLMHDAGVSVEGRDPTT